MCRSVWIRFLWVVHICNKYKYMCRSVQIHFMCEHGEIANLLSLLGQCILCIFFFSSSVVFCHGVCVCVYVCAIELGFILFWTFFFLCLKMGKTKRTHTLEKKKCQRREQSAQSWCGKKYWKRYHELWNGWLVIRGNKTNIKCKREKEMPHDKKKTKKMRVTE